MNPETVKKAYGLIVPNRLLKPMIISDIAITKTITTTKIKHELWCLMFVSSILFFLFEIRRTMKASKAKKKEVSAFIKAGR